MSAFILFAMSTRPDALMISLKQVGMPSSLAYIIVTTLQIVQEAVRTGVDQLRAAQRAFDEARRDST